MKKLFVLALLAAGLTAGNAYAQNKVAILMPGSAGAFPAIFLSVIKGSHRRQGCDHDCHDFAVRGRLAFAG